MTERRINYSTEEDCFWVERNGEVHRFEWSSAAKDAVHQWDLEDAAVAERKRIAQWLLTLGADKLAYAVENGGHLK